MAKYHLSPTTGQPAPCRASIRDCPVGGDHYDSVSEAYAGLEKEMGGSFGPVAALEIVNRETGQVEDVKSLTEGEASMPGYVETVEKTYEGSAWTTRRIPREEEEWCGVCSRPTDHFGEHDDLVEAGLAEYSGPTVRKTANWDDDLAKKVSEAGYVAYEARFVKGTDNPATESLREELKRLEALPGRHQHGFPEDEMVRYNIETAIKNKIQEIQALDPSYDPGAVKAAEDAERARDNVIASARFQSNEGLRYEPLPTTDLPQPGGKIQFEDVAIASTQVNKSFPGVPPRKIEDFGRINLVVPNAGRMTARKKLALANELARLSGANLEKWDQLPQEERVRWVESRLGKYDELDFEVGQDGRVSWSSRYSSSNLNDPSEVRLVSSL